MNLNYTDTFIAASEDGPSASSVPPKGKRSIAEIQYEMLVERPYQFTQEDILFASSADPRERPELRNDADLRHAFFSRSQACLRTSPLVKKWGFGIHFNAQGKAAAFRKETPEYDRWASNPSLYQTKGMRSKRA
jgi:hypothetical protein